MGKEYFRQEGRIYNNRDKEMREKWCVRKLCKNQCSYRRPGDAVQFINYVCRLMLNFLDDMMKS